MEIHAHSHTPRKKWTHYLWEFLMLFLAVFCGFLAENQREHFIEHKREKQYIRSMIRDVATDTLNINDLIHNPTSGFIAIERNCDSLIEGFDEYSKHFTVAGERRLGRLLGWGFPDFIYTDRTMQQLKNAGGLRLIRNLTAVDSIIGYDAAVRDLLMELAGIGESFTAIRNFQIENFNVRKLHELRKNHSATEIEKMKVRFWASPTEKVHDKLYSLIWRYKRVIKSRAVGLNRVKHQGMRLIQVLMKEYHLR